MTIKCSTKVRAVKVLVTLIVLSVVFGAVAPTVVATDDDGHGNECDGYDESNSGNSSGVADSGIENWQRNNCANGGDEGTVKPTPTPEGNATPGGTDTPQETTTPTNTPNETGTPDNTETGPTNGNGGTSGGGSDSTNPGAKTPESRDSTKLTRSTGGTSSSDGGNSNDGTGGSGTGDDGANEAGDDGNGPDNESPKPELNAEQNRQDGTPSSDVELSAGAIWWLFLLAMLALLLTGGAVYRYYTE